MANELTGAKSAWQRPENYFTWVVTLAVIGAGLIGLSAILPMLITLMLNLYYALALGAGLALVGWILFSKDWHTLIWYGYKMMMRQVTRAFIEIDPIAIMEIYAKQLQTNVASMSQSIGALRQQARKIEERINDTAHEQQHSLELANQARKGGNPTNKRALLMQARKAGKLEDSNITYQGLSNKLQAHIRVAEKMKEAAEFMCEDISDTVRIETDKRNMIHESYKAMAAARRVIQGGAQREMYDLALESVRQDYFSKLGEIDQFMEDSQNFMSTMDLENGVYESNALAKLDAWEKRSDELMEGTGKSRQLPSNQFRVAALPAASDASLVETPRDRESFADLFDVSKK